MVNDTRRVSAEKKSDEAGAVNLRRGHLLEVNWEGEERR